MQTEDEPVNASVQMRQAINRTVRTPGARIVLVTVTTASDAMTAPVQQPIADLLNTINDVADTDPIAVHHHMGQGDLFNSLEEEPHAAVDLHVNLVEWGTMEHPNRLYYGRLSGVDVGAWFAEHGNALFAENIRVVIPRSDINDGIAETVIADPEHFTYYNNGITILAREIVVAAGGGLNKDAVYLGLKSASIVNGAQTVSSLGTVQGELWEENLAKVSVLARVIEIGDDDPDLPRKITQFANTQNEVATQDFAFLDKEQHRLAKELRAVDYEYLIRQSESAVSDDSSAVITVRDAAVALACAHPDVTYAVTAKREVSRLFDRSANEYPTLFNPQTHPLLLLRSVLLVREVDRVLDAIAVDATGVEAGVAVHGRRVIAHRILAAHGQAQLKSADFDLVAAIAAVDAEAKAVLAELVAKFPDNSYPGNVFKNAARVKDEFQ